MKRRTCSGGDRDALRPRCGRARGPARDRARVPRPRAPRGAASCRRARPEALGNRRPRRMSAVVHRARREALFERVWAMEVATPPTIPGGHVGGRATAVAEQRRRRREKRGLAQGNGNEGGDRGQRAYGRRDGGGGGGSLRFPERVRPPDSFGHAGRRGRGSRRGSRPSDLPAPGSYLTAEDGRAPPRERLWDRAPAAPDRAVPVRTADRGSATGALPRPLRRRRRPRPVSVARGNGRLCTALRHVRPRGDGRLRRVRRDGARRGRGARSFPRHSGHRYRARRAPIAAEHRWRRPECPATASSLRVRRIPRRLFGRGGAVVVVDDDRRRTAHGVGSARQLAREVRPSFAVVASDPRSGRPRGGVVVGALYLSVHLLAVHAEPAALVEDAARVAQGDGVGLTRSGPSLAPHGGVLRLGRGGGKMFVWFFWDFWVLGREPPFWRSARARGAGGGRVQDASGRSGTHPAGARRIGARQHHPPIAVASLRGSRAGRSAALFGVWRKPALPSGALPFSPRRRGRARARGRRGGPRRRGDPAG